MSKVSSGILRLSQEDFNLPCSELAKYLLGKILTRCVDGRILRGKIVETESYPGGDDECSHSFNYKQTARNKAMFMDPGTVYVYITYGMYYCMNISSKGLGSAVLLRALEPLEGMDQMEVERRSNRKVKRDQPMKTKNLCNGPSKLCQALSITKSHDQADLVTGKDMWVEMGENIDTDDIVIATRIGLNLKKPGYDAPLRFYIKDNINVSVIRK